MSVVSQKGNREFRRQAAVEGFRLRVSDTSKHHNTSKNTERHSTDRSVTSNAVAGGGFSLSSNNAKTKKRPDAQSRQVFHIPLWCELGPVSVPSGFRAHLKSVALVAFIKVLLVMARVIAPLHGHLLQVDVALLGRRRQ
jgi:hypothetical protein